jgi:hypothetical protein
MTKQAFDELFGWSSAKGWWISEAEAKSHTMG